MTASHAVQAGAGTPESDEASAAVGAARGFREQTGGEKPDSVATDADCKEFSRLRAQLALRGHCAFRTVDRADSPVRYVITRGGWLRELNDLAALREFVDRIGGAR